MWLQWPLHVTEGRSYPHEGTSSKSFMVSCIVHELWEYLLSVVSFGAWSRRPSSKHEPAESSQQAIPVQCWTGAILKSAEWQNHVHVTPINPLEFQVGLWTAKSQRQNELCPNHCPPAPLGSCSNVSGRLSMKIKEILFACYRTYNTFHFYVSRLWNKNVYRIPSNHYPMKTHHLISCV